MVIPTKSPLILVPFLRYPGIVVMGLGHNTHSQLKISEIQRVTADGFKIRGHLSKPPCSLPGGEILIYVRKVLNCSHCWSAGTVLT